MLWAPWSAAARRIPSGRQRENVLTVFGPLSLILLLIFWASSLVVSFGILHWALGSPLEGPKGTSGFGTDIYMSGTTFFTLGLGDVTPQTRVARGLTVLEGGLGFAFLALVIGYLPLISQAFSSREVFISKLDARAGSPPTAAQFLRRHCLDADESLRGVLHDWENWSAEILESHISFPQLCYFRSQHNDQSWVAALTTLLDVCGLLSTRIEDGIAPAARMTFAMARHAVVDLCAVLNLPAPAPAEDRLPPEERKRLESFLSAAGVRLRKDEASAAEFATQRATYEPYVHALADKVMMSLPKWVPPEGVPEHWHLIA
jgi:hypothetical protein